MERAAKQTMASDDDEKTQLIKAIHSQLGQDIARGTISGVGLRKHFSAMMQILTGEEMKIKASNQPKFKAGKGLKDSVN
jgi:hypothetical protein